SLGFRLEIAANMTVVTIDIFTVHIGRAPSVAAHLGRWKHYANCGELVSQPREHPVCWCRMTPVAICFQRVGGDRARWILTAKQLAALGEHAGQGCTIGRRYLADQDNLVRAGIDLTDKGLHRIREDWQAALLGPLAFLIHIDQPG